MSDYFAPVDRGAEYCVECVCVCVSLLVRISQSRTGVF